MEISGSLLVDARAAQGIYSSILATTEFWSY